MCLQPCLQGIPGLQNWDLFWFPKGDYFFLDLEEASVCSYTGAYKSQSTSRIPGTFLLWLSPWSGQVAFACISVCKMAKKLWRVKTGEQ